MSDVGNRFKGFVRRFRSSNWTEEREREERKRMEDMNFGSDEERTLFYEARLGLDVAEFWDSDAGKYLRRRCAHDVRESLERLLAASPLNAGAIAQEQTNIKAARRLISLINDAIQGGENAELELNQREEMSNEEE